MRRSVIWFVLAVAWGVDCLLAFFHHNRVQAGLTALFFRKREQNPSRKPQVPPQR
jgi:hypothetical protein